MSRQSLRLVLAQGADALTLAAFYVFVAGSSPAREQNPLVLGLMAAGGVQLVLLAKVGAALLVGWRADRTPRATRLRVVAMSVATASGICGAGFNLAAIVRPTG
jgi:hypothetical protein